jgi:tRNA pseudouridine55 synthase
MHGIINIYKEQGYTSFDVVAKLRGIMHVRKIGHTGTLDPDAEGVLPVCIGNATTLCDMLTDKTKEYETVMRLGIVTDTQDVSGTVIKEKDVNLTEADVISCTEKFTGDIEQIPPMYSAIKIDGKKLYELAREGKTIERKPRPVTIHAIDILSIDLPRVRMRISCSKGTYIRTLCHDIGETLGCGACMESLIRTRSGQFRIEDAVKLATVQEWADEGILESRLMPIEEMFSDCGSLYINASGDKLLHNGNVISRICIDRIIEGSNERYKVYDSQGIFYGVYDYEARRKIYKPFKMFIP